MCLHVKFLTSFSLCQHLLHGYARQDFRRFAIYKINTCSFDTIGVLVSIDSQEGRWSNSLCDHRAEAIFMRLSSYSFGHCAQYKRLDKIAYTIKSWPGTFITNFSSNTTKTTKHLVSSWRVFLLIHTWLKTLLFGLFSIWKIEWGLHHDLSVMFSFSFHKTQTNENIILYATIVSKYVSDFDFTARVFNSIIYFSSTCIFEAGFG